MIEHLFQKSLSVTECVDHIRSTIETTIRTRQISDWKFHQESQTYQVLNSTIKLEISENEFIKIQFGILTGTDEIKVYVPQLQYTKNLDEWVTHAINKNIDILIRSEEDSQNIELN